MITDLESAMHGELPDFLGGKSRKIKAELHIGLQVRICGIQYDFFSNQTKDKDIIWELGKKLFSCKIKLTCLK